MSASVAYSGFVASSVALNGVPVGLTSGVVSNAGGPFVLGGRYYLTSRQGYEGRIFCVRLYNRALTAAEVAANYAIDKARFKLLEAD